MPGIGSTALSEYQLWRLGPAASKNVSSCPWFSMASWSMPTARFSACANIVSASMGRSLKMREDCETPCPTLWLRGASLDRSATLGHASRVSNRGIIMPSSGFGVAHILLLVAWMRSRSKSTVWLSCRTTSLSILRHVAAQLSIQAFLLRSRIPVSHLCHASLGCAVPLCADIRNTRHMIARNRV